VNRRDLIWTVFVVAALLMLDILGLTTYGVVIPALALVLILGVRSVPGERAPTAQPRVDTRDLTAIAVSYLLVVACFRLAFTVFTADRVTGLFLTFAAGLLVGVIGPLIYTVWMRQRPLSTLGIGLQRWRSALSLGLLFAAVQFAITLWGYRLPKPVDWVPLFTMSLTVGLFEAIFFRGFIQGRLEDSFGTGPALFGAAALYALYHVGYGMGGSEMVFLFGLGVVYAVAYRLVENILVLWPLLTPLGSFFDQLQGGGLAGKLPWLSIAGFGDVLAAMAIFIWLAYRRQRKRETRLPDERTQSAAVAGP
jgi:membrane protease YdiL (CAAX protease family)